MITESLSKSILTVGVKYINHRGGIGAVIESYAIRFPFFNFVATYKPQKYKINIVFYFFYGLIVFFIKILRYKEIKIIHLHGAAYGSFYRLFIIWFISKKIFNKKTIYHSHGSEFKKFYLNSNALIKKLITLFINDVDYVICLSESWRSFFQINFNCKVIEVLENIIEPPRFNKKKTNDSVLILLFLGLIGPRKGIFDLIEAIKNNKDIFTGKIKLIIGGNGEIEKLLSYIHRYELEDIIEYRGWVSGDLKHELLSQSNIYILPSYNEGLPLSVLEAMSYRLPVISTPVGGISEIVHNGVNGFLVNPGDKLEIAKCISTFLNNPALIEKMGESSYDISKPYLPDNVIPKLSKIYTRVLSNN
ncbi:glycosyltransferase family 4 protein [Tellurirhabdus rosea]|uniref:glycosyltransferase family 4 protein n=1 Tax=Tellurirhabdus rosea TaxID=2674997 RepID=UPI002259F175|nr:glycosyltransferase family 4 protein [Tellurirhabdus rosea]